MRTLQTTFGSLPIGTAFERSIWKRNTTGDRRRFSLQQECYVKHTHGTIAGFAGFAGFAARRIPPNRYERFDHYQLVYVDASDLRLAIAIVQEKYRPKPKSEPAKQRRKKRRKLEKEK